MFNNKNNHHNIFGMSNQWGTNTLFNGSNDQILDFWLTNVMKIYIKGLNSKDFAAKDESYLDNGRKYRWVLA